jgi:hypothetical protein
VPFAFTISSRLFGFVFHTHVAPAPRPPAAYRVTAIGQCRAHSPVCMCMSKVRCIRYQNERAATTRICRTVGKLCPSCIAAIFRPLSVARKSPTSWRPTIRSQMPLAVLPVQMQCAAPRVVCRSPGPRVRPDIDPSPRARHRIPHPLITGVGVGSSQARQADATWSLPWCQVGHIRKTRGPGYRSQIPQADITS